MAMNSTEGLMGGAKPKYTFSIDLFRGVDYADNSWEMNEQRSPDMMNMISGENGSIKCRNGYEEILKLDGKINGIYTLARPEGDHILVHHGTKLSRWFDYVEGTYTVPEEGLKVLYSFPDPLLSDTPATGGYLQFEDLPFKEVEGDRYGMFYEIETDEIGSGVGRMDVNGKRILCQRVNESGGTPIVGEIVKYGYCAVITRQMYLDAVASGWDGYTVCFTGESVGKGSGYYRNHSFLSGAGYLSADDLPAEGLRVFYIDDGGDGRIFTYRESDGSKYTMGAQKLSELPDTDLVVDAEFLSYQVATPPSVYRYLLSNNDETYSYGGVLSPGDEVDFVFETKRLTVNGKRAFLSDYDAGTEIPLQKESKESLVLREGLADRKSCCQQMGEALYILDGYTGYVYKEFEIKDESGQVGAEEFEARTMAEEAYTPVIMIGCAPIKTTKDHSSGQPVDSGGGPSADSPYEATNLLSDKRVEQFMVTEESTSNTPLDGEGTWYYKLPLSVSPIKEVNKVEEFLVTGEWMEVEPSEYEVDKETGIITFDHSLHVTPLSDVSAADNYRVTYTVDYSGTTETKTKYFDTLDRNNPQDDVTWEWYEFYKPGEVPKLRVPLYHVYLGEDIIDTEVTAKLMISYTLCDKHGDEISPPFVMVKAAEGDELQEQTFFTPEGEEVYFKLTGTAETLARVMVNLRREGSSCYLDITNPISYGIGDLDYYFYEDDLRIDVHWRGDLYKDRINKAKISTKFGYGGNMDRLFVAGYDEMPEYEFWSEINNPLYFPDLNYAACGDGDTRIMGWNRVGNNQLAIHKESNGQDPTVYIQRAELNEDYSVNFPVTEGATGVGVISERSFAVLNGEPLALSKYGVFETRLVEDIPTDIKYAAPRSFYINPELRKLDLSEAEAISFDNKYFLAAGGKVYIADGNQKYMIGGNEGYDFSYEWYPWDNIPVRVWWVYRDELYFGTADGRILKFNDGFYDLDKPVECYWYSKPINFGQPAYYKKVKNMSVTVQPAEWCEVNIDYITGSMNKTVRTQSIHSDDNLPVTIPTNYKAKRIQDIQFKIWGRNAEPLEVINLTVLYTIGGRYKGM